MDHIIDNVFIGFGTDIVCKQIIGIPIGIHPATFFANFFMFHYELDFARRVLTAARYDITAAFSMTQRYIDDIVALNNRFIHKLLSEDDVMDGIHGIYPRCLNITSEQRSSIRLRALDTEVYRLNGVWATKIYDKRLHPPLNKVQHILFPDIDSFISRTAKYGVVTSQLTRYHRLIATKHEFTKQTVTLLSTLLDKGYELSILRKATARYVNNHGYMYGIKSPKSFIHNIFRDVLIRCAV